MASFSKKKFPCKHVPGTPVDCFGSYMSLTGNNIQLITDKIVNKFK